MIQKNKKIEYMRIFFITHTWRDQQRAFDSCTPNRKKKINIYKNEDKPKERHTNYFFSAGMNTTAAFGTGFHICVYLYIVWYVAIMKRSEQ